MSVDPATLRSELEGRFDFRRPNELGDLVSEVAGLLREGLVHVTHPRYFGLFNPSVRPAAVMGDVLAAGFNPQLAVWSHAPAVQEIEHLVLGRLARVLGFERDEVVANFTSGGAEANLSAVLVALTHREPSYAVNGLASLAQAPVLYLTEESHHSFVKIARMAGLGTSSIREVPLTRDLVMDTDALQALIDRDRRDGFLPLAVVATAGTTGSGHIDPLDGVAEVAAESGIWYHVDAAWGAAAALSPRLKPLLAGIERADSVTWDAHKWLSVPMGAGMFFCRHAEAVRRAFDVSTSYMPGPEGEQTTDPYRTTVQWSRRAIGLKVFMALAEIGLDGYRDLIEHQTDMGDLLRGRLRDAGWEVVNRTALPLVCFTHPWIRAGRTSTTGILDVIAARGRVWISDVSLGPRNHRVLRACITSYETRPADLDALVEELEAALQETSTVTSQTP